MQLSEEGHVDPVFPEVLHASNDPLLLLLLLSRFSRVRLCATPKTAAHQAPRTWDSPGKNTGVGCHFLLQCMKVNNHDGVITDLEPDILECEVKWGLESITTNEASGGNGIPGELFKF